MLISQSLSFPSFNIFDLMLVIGINPAQNPTSPASHTVHLYGGGQKKPATSKG